MKNDKCKKCYFRTMQAWGCNFSEVAPYSKNCYRDKIPGLIVAGPECSFFADGELDAEMLVRGYTEVAGLKMPTPILKAKNNTFRLRPERLISGGKV